mgnify:CR=1 FL=1
MKKKFVVFLSIVMWSSFVHSNQDCEIKWDDMSERIYQKGDLPGMIKNWTALETSCSKSDFFYLKLGWLLIEAAEFDKARDAFLKGVELSGNFKVDVELGLIDLYFQRATRSSNTLDKALLETANIEIEKFVQKHPQRAEGLALISGVKLVLEEYETSVNYGLRAVKIADLPVAYRNMAISYSRLLKAEETIGAANNAIELMDSLVGDRDLMLAVSMAYYELDEIELSYGIMQMLVEANPALGSDPLVNRIGVSIQRKFKELKEKK